MIYFLESRVSACYFVFVIPAYAGISLILFLDSPPDRRAGRLQHFPKGSLCDGNDKIFFFSFTHAREIDICDLYVFFSSTLEKYGSKTRRAKCPTRKLSEFASANEFFLVNDASRGFTHIFLQS
jgi:hypothetical protein